MATKTSKIFEDWLISLGFCKVKVLGGWRFFKEVHDDMNLVVAKHSTKWKNESEYHVGFQIPSIELVVSDFQNDMILESGLKIKFSHLSFITFSDIIIRFSHDEDDKSIRKSYDHFMMLVGDDYPKIKNNLLKGLDNFCFPSWAYSWIGSSFKCERYFVRCILKGEVPNSFYEHCSADLDIVKWYKSKGGVCLGLDQ